MAPVFYFGCVGVPGHYWHQSVDGHAFGIRPPHGDGWVGPYGNPWRPKDRGGLGIDGVLAPRVTVPTKADSHGGYREHGRTYEAEQGVAALHVVDGWTAIAFWDRSVDKRGACNSNFVTHDVVDFDEMVRRSRAAFPHVWARFPFEVRQAAPR